MKFADLHLHTIYSDGTYTPEQLVGDSRKAGLSCISVVDHDTVDGLSPTFQAASKDGLEVLPGIELTCEYQGKEVHLLGYLIDYQHKKLSEKLEFLRQNRIERIYKMADKLKGLGMDMDAEEVFRISGSGTVGRLHLARVMVSKGFVSSTGEVFQRYLGDGKPAYVCGFRLNPQEAISLIREAQGIPVLAHPYVLGNDELIASFAKWGIMGLEVYYPEHTSLMVKKYLGLAEKYNLLATGGSDCHGEAKPEVRIGSCKIPYVLVEKLKAAKGKT